MQLAGKKIGLLGFGVENKALLAYLRSKGAKISIIDRDKDLERPGLDIEMLLGEDYLEHLQNFDVIFRSPGIPYLTPQIQAAKLAGVEVSSQIKLFFSQNKARTIGVTGTKGKGTTSSLIKHILDIAKEGGELEGEVYFGGNIGVPIVDLLDSTQSQDWVVLELSSFQLQDLGASPHIAVVLNVTTDHLDYHQNRQEYWAAKRSIVLGQSPEDFVVVSPDFESSEYYLSAASSQAYYYSRFQEVERGCFVKDSQIILRQPGQDDRSLCNVDEISLPGPYNLENVCAAVAASTLAGASVRSVSRGLVTFTGLPHRLELVAEKEGVRYYDNSMATVPDATISAISAFDLPVTLIVGGSSKGADFDDLAVAIANSTVENIIWIGPEGERIRDALLAINAKANILEGGGSMGEIVQKASEISKPGSVVLLSPAAASFGMFKNAYDRGDQFKQQVELL